MYRCVLKINFKKPTLFAERREVDNEDGAWKSAEIFKNET